MNRIDWKVEEEKAKVLVKYEIEDETRRQQVARQQEPYNAVGRLREILRLERIGVRQLQQLQRRISLGLQVPQGLPEQE